MKKGLKRFQSVEFTCAQVKHRYKLYTFTKYSKYLPSYLNWKFEVYRTYFMPFVLYNYSITAFIFQTD